MLMVHKIGIFVHGHAIHMTARALGFEIDFRRLLSTCEQWGEVLRAYYYAASRDGSDTSLCQLEDWLEYNGFTVRWERAKIIDKVDQSRDLGFRLGVDMVVDVLEISRRVNEIYFFCGDGNLRALVEALQRRGVRATVVSTARAGTATVADVLRRQADNFIDLETLKKLIERAPVATAHR